jgi:hypothetical protein
MALSRSSVLHYWSSRYGPLPVIGGKPVHSRNSAGFVADGRGEWYNAIINTPRFATEVDKSTPANERRAMLLLEGARPNQLTRSNDLSHAAWTTASGTGTASLNAIGMDGSPNAATTLTDSDAAGFYGRYNSVTIANDGDTLAARFWILKDSNTTRFPILVFGLQGGVTPKTQDIMLNTSTGAIASSSISGGGSAGAYAVFDDGLYWQIVIHLQNNATGNTTARASVYPAGGSVMGTEAAASTGSCVVGNVHVEPNATAGITRGTPIFTAAGAASRSADSFYWNFPAPPQAMMIHSRHVESGGDSARRIFEISSATETGPVFAAFISGGFYAIQHYNGVGSVTQTLGAAPALGDTVDLAALLTPTGQVQLIQSINGAAVSTSALSGALSLPAAWGDTKLWLGAVGAVASSFGLNRHAEIRAVKYGDVAAVTSQGIMDELRGFELGPNGDQL